MAKDGVVKRVVWSGVLTGAAALSSVLAQRVAASLWRRVFGEEPPE